MAGQNRRAEFESDDLDDQNLHRLLMWLAGAAVAVGSVVLAARSEHGAERLSLAWAKATGAVQAWVASMPSSSTGSDKDVRRLTEVLQSVTADRDRLLERLDELENKVAATGSVSARSPAGTPNTPHWAPPITTLTTTPVGQPSSERAARSIAAAVGPSATSSIATRTEFGIDIGGGQSIDVLRALWGSLVDRYPTQLTSLRPIIAVREGGRAGNVELRLVAGPLNNAVTAAELCGSFIAAGHPCQPTIFDGQRLAIR